MSDAEVCNKLRTFFIPRFLNKTFELDFTYNDKSYTTRFVASHTDSELTVHNECVDMTFEYTVKGKPRQKFIGKIESDSKERACFEPILLTNVRNKPGKRTTNANVLQILKTKLGLTFPTSVPITIFDGARNDMTMISPFYLLRGGDAFYEKFGYKSSVITELKSLLKDFLWKDCNEEQRSMISDYTGIKEYPSTDRLMDIMKTISWDHETTINIQKDRSLSYRVFRWFALLCKAYTFEQTNQFAIDSIWEFTLDVDDPRWKRSCADLVFTKFREIAVGGRRRKSRKIYKK
jgi:hypothetical protein